MTTARLRTADFDYYLPPERIAQHPAVRRDASRLLVVERATGELRHRRFADLAALIPAGDVLVLNRTRVFPARLLGHRAGGGAAEVLLLRPDRDGLWRALVRPGARLPPGRTVAVGAELRVEVVEALAGGERLVRMVGPLDIAAALERYGRVPLPPYMRREAEPEDAERYQTVYARESGSVAAPTAGLHFTPELLEELRERGVEIVEVLLHVGPGTFRPVDADDPAGHPMHAEWYRVEAVAAAAINAAREHGAGVWAVGTTVARTLESSVGADGRVGAGEGWTELFIRPPYVFRAMDRLITNFHLPRSTLLMLVAAFAEYETTMRAYRSAVEGGYRFYSYGDAMAVV